MNMSMTGQDWEGKCLTEIDMSQLELEYDYDTDEPQLCAAKSMLLRDNLEAIQYCVMEDP